MCSIAGWSGRRTHERAKFVRRMRCGPSAWRMCSTAADVDVVVELMGGLDPAEGWLRAALSAGKHVVTANKQLIAYRGAELFALAAEKGVQLLYGRGGGGRRAGDSGDCAGAERRRDYAHQRDCEWDVQFYFELDGERRGLRRGAGKGAGGGVCGGRSVSGCGWVRCAREAVRAGAAGAACGDRSGCRCRRRRLRRFLRWTLRMRRSWGARCGRCRGGAEWRVW